jgi:hypothetical protein
MTPIDMLDHVLSWFAKKSDEYNKFGTTVVSRPAFTKNDALKEMQKDNEVFRSAEFLIFADMVLDKIVSDGYIKYFEQLYSITFEGKLFHQTGGYSAEYKNESNRKFLRSLEKWLIVGGTVFAGLYGLFEMIKAICKLW